MNTDYSKLFLFMILSLAVLVIVTDKRRPLAAAPLDGGTTGESQTLEDRSLITRGPGFANVACNGMVPPLMLMMPRQGVMPAGGCDE